MEKKLLTTVLLAQLIILEKLISSKKLFFDFGKMYCRFLGNNLKYLIFDISRLLQHKIIFQDIIFMKNFSTIFINIFRDFSMIFNAI